MFFFKLSHSYKIVIKNKTFSLVYFSQTDYFSVDLYRKLKFIEIIKYKIRCF